MHEELLKTIFTNTYTKTDLYRRIGVLKEFLEHYFYDTEEARDPNRRSAFAVYAKENDIDPAAAQAIGEWEDAFFNTFTADNFYDTLAAATKAAEALPELTLYVPVSLDAAHTAKIGAWCRENIPAQPLLEVKTDPNAAGGCIFAWQGVYHDFSLTHFLRKREGDVLKLVQSYGSE